MVFIFMMIIGIVYMWYLYTTIRLPDDLIKSIKSSGMNPKLIMLIVVGSMWFGFALVFEDLTHGLIERGGNAVLVALFPLAGCGALISIFHYNLVYGQPQPAAASSNLPAAAGAVQPDMWTLGKHATAVGAVVVVCTLYVALFVISVNGSTGLTRAAQPAATEDPLTEAVLLHAAFTPHLSGWQSIEQRGVHRVIPASIGYPEPLDAVYYGVCGERRSFFLFVLLPASPEAERHYAYLPNGALRCPGMNLDVTYHESLGSGWYKVTLPDATLTTLRTAPLID